MVEHIVHNDKHSKESGPGTTLYMPAPMVERAFRLLDLLVVAEEEGMALSDLARALKMSKGSLHGLLKTLENCGVIEQHENRLYALGPRIYNLATYILNTGLRHLALPAMERLAKNIGETVFLGRVEQDFVRVIASVEAGSEHLYPHIAVPKGTRVPLLAGVVGRIVFASWPLERRRAWLDIHPLPHFTAHSITAPDQFLVAVEETARTGIATDYGEYLNGVNAVAVPIVGLGGSLVALLCVLGFASNFDNVAMQAAGSQLVAESEIISRSFPSK